MGHLLPNFGHDLVLFRLGSHRVSLGEIEACRKKGCGVLEAAAAAESASPGHLSVSMNY